MKKRKVGKMVSLLVATILVATAMIPAAGVLAESIEAAANRNAVISVTNLDALHAHIKSATNANGYSDKNQSSSGLMRISRFRCSIALS